MLRSPSPPAVLSSTSVRCIARALPMALALVFLGCEGGLPENDWNGVVHPDVDELTREWTGLFRTYGPTRDLVAGSSSIPVTIGYYCRRDDDTSPVSITDGLFFKVSMPDTSLVKGDKASFEEISGRLGLLDVARMSVDGRVYVWQYEPESALGAWYIDGTMGHVPPGDEALATYEERDRLLAQIGSLYRSSVDLGVRVGKGAAARDLDQAAEQIREDWTTAYDYTKSHYMGRDTTSVELKRVMRFPMRGFDVAMDSARSNCPIARSHREWNNARTLFMNQLDSARVAYGDSVTVLTDRRRAERERVARERVAREAARKDSVWQAANERLRSTRVMARAAVEKRRRRTDSIRAAEEKDARDAAEAENLLVSMGMESAAHRSSLIGYAKKAGYGLAGNAWVKEMCADVTKDKFRYRVGRVRMENLQVGCKKIASWLQEDQ